MSQLDLISIFKAVTETLAENQQSLNEADSYNHNHGDNMVKTFETITRAAEKSKVQTPSAQMAAASKELSKSSSGSAQIYAQGLKQASQQFKGKELTADNVGTLINSLMGMDATPKTQPAPAKTQVQENGGGDLLSTLLGSLIGQDPSKTQQKPQQNESGGDLLGQLLGGLLGGGQQQEAPQQPQDQGTDLGGLLGSLLGGSGSQQQIPQQKARQGQLQRAKPRQQQPQQDSGGDLLGELLGGLLGGGQTQQPSTPQRSQPQQESGGGLLDTLLGSLLGGGTNNSQSEQPSPEDLLGSLLSGTSNKTTRQQAKKQGLDIGSLLSAGLAYYAAKKGGKSSLEAI
ncbi:MAG: hypothetical protein VB108_04955, partial [Anaerolineaceae bacterium]|nr:hypothetical protein [Anaerolineaceae bacterium]